MSPTISIEGMLLTAVIKAQEGQDITTCNIPNTFVQTFVLHHEDKGSLR